MGYGLGAHGLSTGAPNFLRFCGGFRRHLKILRGNILLILKGKLVKECQGALEVCRITLTYLIGNKYHRFASVICGEATYDDQEFKFYENLNYFIVLGNF